MGFSLLLPIPVVESIFLGDVHEVKEGSPFLLSGFLPLNTGSTSLSAAVMSPNAQHLEQGRRAAQKDNPSCSPLPR